MSKHTVRSGDVAGLWSRVSQLKDKVQIRMGQVVPIIVIQEAVWTAFGSTDCRGTKGSKATLLIPLQSRRGAGVDGRRLRRSTGKLWCERR